MPTSPPTIADAMLATWRSLFAYRDRLAERLGASETLDRVAERLHELAPEVNRLRAKPLDVGVLSRVRAELSALSQELRRYAEEHAPSSHGV